MGHTSDLDTFLNLHRDQLVLSGIPELYWSELNEKIQNQIFNAGETFQLLQIDYEREKLAHEPAWGLQVISKINKSDSKHIYLVDHAWTFRVGHAKNQLLQFSHLRSRMCNILGLKENQPKEEIVDKIFDHIWKLCHTYSVRNAHNIEDRLPIWYVMDEIGSAVMHSDTPNCRIVPFIHVNTQITYSLLFPIEDIEEGDFVYKDFAEGIYDADQRLAALLPWKPHSFENVDFNPPRPGPDYFLSGHVEETLPKLFVYSNTKILKEKYAVYTEYSLIREYLTDNRFEIVDSEDEADILWYSSHFKDYANLSHTPEKFVNQFPFEHVITVKDLLSIICRNFSEDNSIKSQWLPITYNLKTEVSNFVSYFQHRERNGFENYWIVKPYNLARSLDIHITNNLNYIMRLPATGPKIAQKYISSPVLFYRPECNGAVKFDIRYVLLLQSVKPLKAYVYNEFFLRFANKPFELNDFHDYEKHFTVMNYEEHVTMKHMLCSEFKRNWEHLYPNFPWCDVQKSILGMFKEVLACAIKEDPPCGIAHSPQSRALYAADLMLEWSESKGIQPKLLEINYTPDCRRACEYYPDFYNLIFQLLFFNEFNDSFTEL